MHNRRRRLTEGIGYDRRICAANRVIRRTGDTRLWRTNGAFNVMDRFRGLCYLTESVPNIVGLMIETCIVSDGWTSSRVLGVGLDFLGSNVACVRRGLQVSCVVSPTHNGRGRRIVATLGLRYRVGYLFVLRKPNQPGVRLIRIIRCAPSLYLVSGACGCRSNFRCSCCRVPIIQVVVRSCCPLHVYVGLARSVSRACNDFDLLVTVDTRTNCREGTSSRSFVCLKLTFVRTVSVYLVHHSIAGRVYFRRRDRRFCPGIYICNLGLVIVRCGDRSVVIHVLHCMGIHSQPAKSLNVAFWHRCSYGRTSVQKASCAPERSIFPGGCSIAGTSNRQSRRACEIWNLRSTRIESPL